jgi:hypothetical protein
MTQINEYLRALDRVEVPDVWRRAVELEPPPGPIPPPPVSSLRRLAVAGSALVVFFAAGWLTWNAFRPETAEPPAGQGTPTGTPAPTGTPTAPGVLASTPLVLPTLGPGGSCPTTAKVTISPRGIGFVGSATAQKAKHVYLVSEPRVNLRPRDRTPEGWYGIKDIWVINGSYSGPVLIRGGRIDGAGSIELGWNPITPRRGSLRIDSGSPSLQANSTTGWRSVPAAAYIRAPGCYAYQIDGIGFTTHIVFEATA